MSNPQNEIPQPRMEYADFLAAAPEVGQLLLQLGQAPGKAGLEKPLTELVKLRVSQVNGCAFCVGFHTNLLRQLEIPQAKLDFLPVWREVAHYTRRERAALAWAEVLTRLDGHGVPDEAYAAAAAEFSSKELLYLTVTIGTINQYNRIGVALRFTPPAG